MLELEDVVLVVVTPPRLIEVVDVALIEFVELFVETEVVVVTFFELLVGLEQRTMPKTVEHAAIVVLFRSVFPALLVLVYAVVTVSGCLFAVVLLLVVVFGGLELVAWLVTLLLVVVLLFIVVLEVLEVGDLVVTILLVLEDVTDNTCSCCEHA